MATITQVWAIFWSGGISAHPSRVSVHQGTQTSAWDPFLYPNPYQPGPGGVGDAPTHISFPNPNLSPLPALTLTLEKTEKA